MKPWDLMEFPNARNSSSTSSPQHCIANGVEYALVVQHDWHAVIWKRPEGGDTWTDHFDLTGYSSDWLVDKTDSHNCLAMTVDSTGRIHIVGNSHDRASEGLRYIRSTTPHNINSWAEGPVPPGWAEGSPTGDVVSTYHTFQKFSDGEVSWAASMSEAFENAWVGGRDWGLWRIPVGSKDPVAVLGGTNAEIMVADGGASATDTIPDRSYLYGHHIDQDDVLHLVGVWRVETADPTTMVESFYVRSRDRGVTWENIMGAPVDAPFTYRKTLDGAPGSAACGVVVGVDPVGFTTFGGLAVDSDGNPFFTGNDNGGFVCFWTGSAWAKQDLATELGSYLDGWAVPCLIGDRMWLFWSDFRLALGTDKGVWCGAPWRTPMTTPLVEMGLISRNTPDGVYTFEDRACFVPTPIWGGGYHRSRPIARFLVPDGDFPAIRSVGELLL